MWFLDKNFINTLDFKAYDAHKIAQNTGLALDLVQKYVDPNRLFMVKSEHHYNFLAGANADGRPCLLFLGTPRMSESTSKYNLNLVSLDKDFNIQTAGCNIADDAHWDDILKAAEDLVGFVHIGNCPFRPFVHPEMWYCALFPMPEHVQIGALGLEDNSDSDMAKNWISNGDYVLYWCNDYYMNKEGEVVSS